MKAYTRLFETARWITVSLSTLTTATACLAQSLDYSFYPNPGGAVRSIAVQADGKILIGGDFDGIGAQWCLKLGRLNPDGSQDKGFDCPADGPVYSLVIQNDWKVLVGGAFTTLAGQNRTNLGRLNADGTLDLDFDPCQGQVVNSLLPQPNGQILVGGGSWSPGGSITSTLGRLNADGSLDSSFNPNPNGEVYSLAEQPDGKILVGGDFSFIAGESRVGIARLNPDGTPDLSFNATVGGTYTRVSCMVVQPDGKILVGGLFDTLNGQSRNHIGRLNADGTLDSSFNPGANDAVVSLALQADGKILVGGNFTFLGGQSRQFIGRLNADGTLDVSFYTAADNAVFALAMEADGKILVGGSFWRLHSDTRPGIGRLYNSEPATQSLTFDGTDLAWMRSGTSPEVWRTSFEYMSPNQPNVWTSLGGGTRAPGGWQITPQDLPINTAFRARGYTLGGQFNGSTWFAQAVNAPWLIIDNQPFSRKNNARSTATFSVYAYGGDSPLGYQWRKEGVNLVNGGNVSGATTPMLTLNDVLGADAGGYSVVITNASECVTSAVAALTVIDPVIIDQPSERARRAGQPLILDAWVTGTFPLSIQWRKDGVNLVNGGKISGALSTTLRVSNPWRADEGGYSVVVANGYGSVTSSVAVVTVADPVIITQPVSQLGRPGQSATFRVVAAGTPPLGYQWRKNGSLVVGATSSVLTLANVQITDAGLYDVMVSNVWDRLISTVAELTILGWVDSFNPQANDRVYALAVQSDNKVLVGGAFSMLGGQNRDRIGRLEPDGALDLAFNPGANGDVYCVVIQPDGRILVGGRFDTLGGQSRKHIGLLEADGTLDGAFKPTASAAVYCLALQPDRKVLVGGSFTTLAGQRRSRLGRLNSDGTLDASFNPAADNGVYSLALQPDGKIVVGGLFKTLCGQSRTNLGRVNSDGTLDASFDPVADGGVYSLALQPDGKIVVGGLFKTLGRQSRTNLGRLNPDGSVDPSFDAVASGRVNSLVVQADGKILAGGLFTKLGGQRCFRIGRLNADGTRDSGFNPGADGAVFALCAQPDGKVLVGGLFGSLNGSDRGIFGRLYNTEPAIQDLNVAGSTLTWMRGGTAPEVWRTTFERLTADGSWSSLGDGQRIPGGWELTGLAVPTGATVRGRGYAAGGYNNGSSWFVETTVGPLQIVTQPASRTNNAGTTASFSVQATASGTLGYQWRKDGANLSDAGKVSGALTASLTLTGVLGADAGGYSVVITNASESVTSAVATLTVIDPVIIVQPVGQTKTAGESATFSVGVAGTAPLSYQWRKDGMALGSATQSVLTLSPLQASDAGKYDVVLTNLWGSASSAVALLTVHLAWCDSFDPGANGQVHSLVPQPDGKILMGGRFTTLGGHSRNHIGRLNPDGTLDDSFDPGANDYVRSLALQTDRKVLAVGSFSSLGGQVRNQIGRLNADGTLDTSFNPGADIEILCLAVQVDDKILVGGRFTTLGGQGRNCIGRLNSDGTLDTSFAPGVGGDSRIVSAVAVQPDGKVLVGGYFTTIGGQSRNSLARLNADGTLDTSFGPGVIGLFGVYCLVVQSDGKILVGGSFYTLGGQSRTNIGRLNADGTLDASFNPGASGYFVSSLALQTDGRILVGGRFNALGGKSRNCIGRLNADGTVDDTFNPGASDGAYCLSVQADGKILVGGVFQTLGGQNRSRIARLYSTEPATQNLTFDGSALTWTRGGSSPEVWRTTFEYLSLNDGVWTSLGASSRIPGGWQLTGLTLPPNTAFRARGYTVGSDNNGSSWFVETILDPLHVSTQSASHLPTVTSGLRPTLSITNLLCDGNGQFQFTASGPAGQVVVIEASPDLKTWTPLQTNILSADPIHFRDPQPAAAPSRFYRLRPAP